MRKFVGMRQNSSDNKYKSNMDSWQSVLNFHCNNKFNGLSTVFSVHRFSVFFFWILIVEYKNEMDFMKMWQL